MLLYRILLVIFYYFFNTAVFSNQPSVGFTITSNLYPQPQCDKNNKKKKKQKPTQTNEKAKA
ncbi:hypothetical protein JP0015_15390 [Helicobacter pylori]